MGYINGLSIKKKLLKKNMHNSALKCYRIIYYVELYEVGVRVIPAVRGPTQKTRIYFLKFILGNQ